MLQQKHRLKQSSRIREIARHGQSYGNRWLVLKKMSNNRSVSRFAFSASRRIGNAVTRNRVKRRLRELVRHSLPHTERGWDVLLIARSAISTATFREIEYAVADILQRAHLCHSLPVQDQANKATMQ
jgi:ribonuclease P protein component